MYVLRKTEMCSCNQCCNGKAISITYSECVFVVIGMQDEMCMRHIVVCGLSASIKTFHMIS
jgi:hypothetical protein